MDEAVTGSTPGGAPRTVDGGRGIAWWGEAWALFTKAAVLWIVLAVIAFIGFAVLGFIPLVGPLAVALLVPVIIGSWMLAARKVEGGGTLELSDLFVCFSNDKLTPLLVLGALLLAGTVVIGLVIGTLGIGAMFGVAAGSAHQNMGGMFAAMGAGLLAVLGGLVLGLLLTMAVWFAPALVVFRNQPPVDALKASFAASLKNIVPFLLWSLIYIVAAIVASIPFGLGWIVLMPVLMLTAYVSYKDVYGLA